MDGSTAADSESISLYVIVKDFFPTENFANRDAQVGHFFLLSVCV